MSAAGAPASGRADTRTLVVAPQWIGDAVMSEPLVRQLAARGERVAVAALPWVAPVYHAMPGVVDVIELPFAHGRLDFAARRRVAASLKGAYDRAIVLPNSLKAALVPWLAHIPLRIGYRGEGRWWLLNRRLPNPPGRPPMVAFYRALAGAPARAGDLAGGADAGTADHAADPADDRVADEEAPHLSFASAEIDAATRAVDVVPGRYWAFAPGAEYGPAKRWPVERYAALARTLQTSGRLPVLLLGSAGEAALCEAIAAAARDACRVVAGRVSLLDAMRLIAGARGVVSNDSGLMHVAAAFAVPQVAVFGSTSPLHTPPRSRRARVIWLKDELGLACMPCFERTCRYGHTRCLVEVDAPRVEAALHDALATG